MNIAYGNAIADGQDFRFWFVGRIEEWCREQGILFDAERFRLRNRDDIEMKWGVYAKGDERAEWASSSRMTGISILLRGDCIFRFRDARQTGDCREVRLCSEGDYVIWEETVQHSWQMLEDSVFLTLRWPGKDK